MTTLTDNVDRLLKDEVDGEVRANSEQGTSVREKFINTNNITLNRPLVCCIRHLTFNLLPQNNINAENAVDPTEIENNHEQMNLNTVDPTASFSSSVPR